MPPKAAGQVQDFHLRLHFQQPHQGFRLAIGDLGEQHVAVKIHVVVDFENGVEIEITRLRDRQRLPRRIDGSLYDLLGDV